VKTYSPGGTKVIAVYDAAANCLSSAYEENKNNQIVISLNCKTIG